MEYVALLRGINVGGNAKVEMSKLKTIFEKIGCQKVSTYINSGNVIFEAKQPHKELVTAIEAAIKKELGMDIPVVVRDADNIKMLCEKIPEEWTNDDECKTDVLFLWDEVDSADVVNKAVINPELENVLYLPGALIWNTGRENVAKGAGVKLIGTTLYRRMTVRNINTVRKLNTLLGN